MAKQKSLIEQLADRGEEAISKLGDIRAAKRALDAATGMKARLDDLSKRVRGLEGMEKRVSALEKRLAKLEGAGKKAVTKTAKTARKTAAKAATAANK